MFPPDLSQLPVVSLLTRKMSTAGASHFHLRRASDFEYDRKSKAAHLDSRAWQPKINVGGGGNAKKKLVPFHFLEIRFV